MYEKQESGKAMHMGATWALQKSVETSADMHALHSERRRCQAVHVPLCKQACMHDDDDTCMHDDEDVCMHACMGIPIPAISGIMGVSLTTE